MPQLVRADHKINYQVSGADVSEAGPVPVALIHGLGANIAFWALGAVRHLGGERPMILHDLRGHGGSGMPERDYGLQHLAADLEYLLETLGARRVHIVGHSHGARVALAFALNHPEKVASLTLADTQIDALQPPMKLKDWAGWPKWKANLQAQGVTTFPDEDREIDFSMLAELGPRGGAAVAGAAVPSGAGAVGDEDEGAGAVEPAATNPALAERPRLAALAAARGGAAGTGPLAQRMAARRGGLNLGTRQMGSRSAKKWDKLLTTTSAKAEFRDEAMIAPARLSGLTMPVLLMYGDTTHCLPTSDKLLELLPQARRVIVPGAGHFFPIAKPRFFALTLRMFLAGVENGDGLPPSFEESRLAARAARPGARRIFAGRARMAQRAGDPNREL